MNEIRKKQKLIQQILLETSIEFYSLIFLDNYRLLMPLGSMIFHSFYILQIFHLYFNDFAMEIGNRQEFWVINFAIITGLLSLQTFAR